MNRKELNKLSKDQLIEIILHQEKINKVINDIVNASSEELKKNSEKIEKSFDRLWRLL